MSERKITVDRKNHSRKWGAALKTIPSIQKTTCSCDFCTERKKRHWSDFR